MTFFLGMSQICFIFLLKCRKNKPEGFKKYLIFHLFNTTFHLYHNGIYKCLCARFLLKISEHGKKRNLDCRSSEKHISSEGRWSWVLRVHEYLMISKRLKEKKN